MNWNRWHVSAVLILAMGAHLTGCAHTLPLAVLHAPQQSGEAAAFAPVTLVKDGKALAAIVLPDAASQPGLKPDRKGAGLSARGHAKADGCAPGPPEKPHRIGIPTTRRHP